MKKLILILVFALVSVGGIAMIETLSLRDLVASSEIVVIGRVLDRKAFVVEDAQVPAEAGVQIVANLFEITQVLKGTVANGERLKIRTFTWILDLEALTGPGEYLVFLEKTEKHYDVVNSPQGCWPVEPDGSFAGMGYDVTLEKLKRQIDTASD